MNLWVCYAHFWRRHETTESLVMGNTVRILLGVSDVFFPVSGILAAAALWPGWVVVVFGILGLLTTISTARTCLAAMRKAAEEASSRSDPPPTAFNDHK